MVDLLLRAFFELLPWMLLLGVPLVLVFRGGWIATFFGVVGLLASAAATFGLAVENHPDIPFIMFAEIVTSVIAIPIGLALRRRRKASAALKRAAA